MISRSAHKSTRYKMTPREWAAMMGLRPYFAMLVLRRRKVKFINGHPVVIMGGPDR